MNCGLPLVSMSSLKWGKSLRASGAAALPQHFIKGPCSPSALCKGPGDSSFISRAAVSREDPGA